MKWHKRRQAKEQGQARKGTRAGKERHKGGKAQGQARKGAKVGYKKAQIKATKDTKAG